MSLNIMIKKLLRWNAIICLAFALFAPLNTQAQDNNDWYIDSFNADITIASDASITVQETIKTDFSSDPRHGIYRSIPVDYRDSSGNKLSLKLDIISIKNEKGTNWNYSTYKNDNNIEIKIGDADTLLKKAETFVITYHVQRATTFFKDHDELYWNVNGSEFEGATFREVSATVSFPTDRPSGELTATCFTGQTGSKEKNCTTEISGDTITFSAKTKTQGIALNPFENLTIVAGAPKGTLTQPSTVERLMWFIGDNLGYTLPFFTFALMFYLWNKYGRDPKVSRTTIMPRYTAPTGMTPGEVGTLLDESADMKDISATIIDLAVRGYIKIVENISSGFMGIKNTKYSFEKLKDIDNTLKTHESKLLTAIFGSGTTCKLEDLKNKFYKELPKIKDEIYNQLVKDGYFPSNPAKVKGLYMGIGMFLFIGTMFVMELLLTIGPSIPFGTITSGIIIAGFGLFMAKKTVKGKEVWYEVKGLEEFIKTAETDRLKFQEKENIFEKLLPYAMTFGIAEKWSKAFEGIYKNPPSWYSSNDPNFISHFNTIYLLNHINSFNTAATTTLASSPRSASGGGSGFSGGFSGGGFGGGGGGRW